MSDSYVTNFTNEDTANSNIDFNIYKLYVNGNAINQPREIQVFELQFSTILANGIDTSNFIQ